MKTFLNTLILAVIGLFLLGATVRVHGAGMACPDWPMCHGKWLPELDFYIFLEWSHRLLAMLIGFAMLALVTWTWVSQAYRSINSGLSLLALLLLICQALMGALTVFAYNSPPSVAAHLGVGLIFLSSLLVMRLRLQEGSERLKLSHPKFNFFTNLLLLFTYFQALLGAWLAASHAGLACPDFPACFGSFLPELQGGVLLQMLHRWTAYAIMLLGAIFLWRSKSMQLDAQLRFSIRTFALLLLVQVSLGIANVLLQLPETLRVAHLGGATLLFLSLVKIRYEC